PGIELLQLLGRKLVETRRLELFRGHHLLDAAADLFLRRSRWPPAAKNQKKAEQKVRNEGATGSVHDVYRLESTVAPTLSLTTATSRTGEGSRLAGTAGRRGPAEPAAN